jgi:transposase
METASREEAARFNPLGRSRVRAARVFKGRLETSRSKPISMPEVRRAFFSRKTSDFRPTPRQTRGSPRLRAWGNTEMPPWSG